MHLTRTTIVLAALVAFGATTSAAQQAHPSWAAARYEASLFSGGGDTWHLTLLEAGTRFAHITPIVRLNRADRFGNDGYQLEVDVYPSLPGVGYAYLSAGYSDGTPFPELRLAGELYATLPNAFEASAGIVWMDFDDDATVLVGSIARYAGNYWLALRPSWALETDDAAISVVARRYLRTPGEFVTARVMAGSTPEEIATHGGRLESFGVQLDGQLEVSRRWLVLPVLGAMQTERAGSGSPQMRYTLGVGGMYRF